VVTSAPGAEVDEVGRGTTEERTRRVMLSRSGAGLAAGLGLVLAGCGGHARPKLPPRKQQADVEVLNHLLSLEQEAVAAYTAGIPLLTGLIAQDARLFLSQELAHVGELISLIKRQGGKPTKPRDTYPLGKPHSRADVLSLFHELERRQIAAYLQAIPIVAPGGARSALAAILGSDAQHVAVIRGALGLSPLAGPFVTAAV
jgi:hypothetical protein